MERQKASMFVAFAAIAALAGACAGDKPVNTAAAPGSDLENWKAYCQTDCDACAEKVSQEAAAWFSSIQFSTIGTGSVIDGQVVAAREYCEQMELAEEIGEELEELCATNPDACAKVSRKLEEGTI